MNTGPKVVSDEISEKKNLEKICTVIRAVQVYQKIQNYSET